MLTTMLTLHWGQGTLTKHYAPRTHSGGDTRDYNDRLAATQPPRYHHHGISEGQRHCFPEEGHPGHRLPLATGRRLPGREPQRHRRHGNQHQQRPGQRWHLATGPRSSSTPQPRTKGTFFRRHFTTKPLKVKPLHSHRRTLIKFSLGEDYIYFI